MVIICRVSCYLAFIRPRGYTGEADSQRKYSVSFRVFPCASVTIYVPPQVDSQWRQSSLV